MSPGKRFRQLVAQQKPLIVAGTINAYTALQAEQAGLKAIYISGAGVANASYGLPDLGITNLNNVLIDVQRIISVTNLPVLVDIDTGLGNSQLAISHTISTMDRAGVAAVHLEDQILQKRCGHRPHKTCVSINEMCDRITAACAGRLDKDFVIIARTDALANESWDEVIKRATAYVAAGADMIFLEAVTDMQQYRDFKEAVAIPLLANITEFGKTPLYTAEELKAVGVDIMLCPLSAFRAMSAASEKVYKAMVNLGTQKSMLETMQTRNDLYEVLDYMDKEEGFND